MTNNKQNLVVLDGGKRDKLDHIYEVHNADGAIVDVLRFNSEEDVADFQNGIIGDYKVVPHTLSPECLVDKVLELRMLDEVFRGEERMQERR